MISLPAAGAPPAGLDPPAGFAPPPDFVKYHALGNDYLAVLAAELATPAVLAAGVDAVAPPAAWVRAACERHRGVGADGLLWLSAAPAGSGCDAQLIIYNADGSQAERSGNGLRMAAQALFDWGRLTPPRLRLLTAIGAVVVTQVEPAAGRRPPVLEVEMGAPRHGLAAVGGAGGDASPVVEVRLVASGEQICPALWLVSVGNPHAVWWRPSLDDEIFSRWAAAISHASIFPRGINVQMAAVQGRQRVVVRIWERGVGPTQASGSSACAVAATAWRQGLCDAPLTVQMPGGDLVVDRSATGDIVLRGPVKLVYRGRWPVEDLAARAT